MRFGWGAAAGLAVGLASIAAGAAAENPYSARLEKMPPPERAAQLAAAAGNWCIGTKTFLMGVADSGREAGFAYWSVACLDGISFAVQIDPLGHWIAIDCAELALHGQGRECFKKF